MNTDNIISLLYPPFGDTEYHVLSDVTCHDLGLDALCEKLTDKSNEQTMILTVLRTMTDDARVARYRIGVFSDIMAHPAFREKIMKLLDQVQFLNDYGHFKKELDIRTGLWELLHRLSELNDYIKSVEAIRESLESFPFRSEGFDFLKQYIDEVYDASLFTELKRDIEALQADTKTLKSITLGINLNDRFEVQSIGLISVNSREFKNSGILANFAGALASRSGIRDGNEWDGSFRFTQISRNSGELAAYLGNIGGYFAIRQQPILAPLLAPVVTARTLGTVPEHDSSAYMTHFLDKEVSHLLSHLTRKLELTLSKFVTLSIGNIARLIPEFMYYIRWAEYLEKQQAAGLSFCSASALDSGKDPEGLPTGVRMNAAGFYNLNLAVSGTIAPADIVKNDLDFSDEHTVYLLTGANRGGKTTLTQAVGLLYVLAQGGIMVPAESFSFVPVDCIYTHYPADEDKTLDLGRLGEECSRFREIFSQASPSSLLLLNETFSTTSFEEGFYIAGDAVRAILHRRCRTIYNTHMHKLAGDIDSLNQTGSPAKAASLVALSDSGRRSFSVKVAPPQGKSYAEDIARKYGVTYELLLQD